MNLTTGRAATETRLDSDPRIRWLLLGLTSGAAYGLTLLTPAVHGPTPAIAGLFTLIFLPLILSVVLPEALRRNRLLGLFLGSLIVNFALILLLLSLTPRFSLGAGSYLLPPALAALVLTILVGSRAGILLVSLIGLGELFLLHPDARYLLSSLVTGVAAVLLSRKIHRRSDLLRAGAGIGLAAFFSTVFFAGVTLAIPGQVFLSEAISAAGFGLLTTLLVGSILPALESLFDRTTDLSWLELTSLDHPLLRRLALEAPGTYLHSVLVAHLAEAAAVATGTANPRACRAMGLYHDIGKLEKPEYFTENMNPTDPDLHALLTPSMSALIILAHVKDGVLLARQQGLPRRIREAIREHHGRGLVWYFYQRALQQEKDARAGGKILRLRDDDIPEVDASSFRYLGPIPQSPETALLSLADAVESASRAMEKPAPGDARKLVDHLYSQRAADHHWDASGLTQTQWQSACQALTHTLESLLRPRIRYPSDRRAHKKNHPPLEQPPATASVDPRVLPSSG